MSFFLQILNFLCLVGITSVPTLQSLYLLDTNVINFSNNLGHEVSTDAEFVEAVLPLTSYLESLKNEHIENVSIVITTPNKTGKIHSAVLKSLCPLVKLFLDETPKLDIKSTAFSEIDATKIVSVPKSAEAILGVAVDADAGLVLAALPLITHFQNKSQQIILRTPSESKQNKRVKIHSEIIKALIPMVKLFASEIPNQILETGLNTLKAINIQPTKNPFLTITACHLFLPCYQYGDVLCEGATSSCECLECIYIYIHMVSECCLTLG
jgi:hypothetical protein